MAFGARSSAPAGWGREVRVVDARAARGGPVVAGDLDRPVRADVHDHDLLVGAAAVDPHPHRLPEQLVRAPSTAPASKDTIGVLPGTVRVTPNATVCGCAGTRCRRSPSSASMSTGARRVIRCTRVFTSLAERLTRRLQLGERLVRRSRLVSVGTRSALASFTVDSVPPLDAGSAGSQVGTVTP